MRLAIILVLLFATTADAEPYHPYAASPGRPPEPTPFRESAYVGGGAGLTFDHFFNAYLDVEGGVRLPELPLWVRGSLAYGASADVEGGGRFLQARLGLETRTCGSGVACLFLGFDVGRQQQIWSKFDEMTEHHEGWVAGPRLGLDAGGERTRFRLALEAYRYMRTSDVDGLPDSTASGAGLTLGVIHRM